MIRPTAIPLITNDPFFSIWAGSEELYGGVTRHWSGKPMPLYIAVKIDGKYYAVCGTDNNYFFLCRRIKQTGVKVTPLSTIYTFENELIKLTIKFTSPLLLDRPDILARPVSYIDYKIERKQEFKEVKFVFGIGALCCINHNQQQVEFKRTPYSMSCGNSFQTPLACAGDCNRIEWGRLHLCEEKVNIAHWISGGTYIRYHEPTLPCTPSVENHHMVVEKKAMKAL